MGYFSHPKTKFSDKYQRFSRFFFLKIFVQFQACKILYNPKKQKNIIKFKKFWKKKFRLRNKKFAVLYRYRNWTLVLVSDIKTWFWSYTRKGGSQFCSRVVANRGLGGKSWWKLLQFHTQLSAQLASSKLDSKQSNWKLFTYSIFISKASFLELVSKELNHLAVILHVYAVGLIFKEKKKSILFFKKKREVISHFW